ncbi:MAG: tetratricopeptide repeat protein [Proteobacteria bacterium]|nr:tetratricopeptide repeat protein [Pseudomonadota bacterium]MBU1060881.1 tetratricopeptide repeat protein [Pseudomonadota bacterium]
MTYSASKSLETTENQAPTVIVQPPPLPVTEEQITREGESQLELSGEGLALPSMEYVNDRIFEYGRKLERWKELDSQAVVLDLDEKASEEMVRCFRELQKVLNGYNKIHGDLLQQDLLPSADLISNREMMQLEQRDIAFLESSCGRLLKSGENGGAGWEKRQEKADLPQIETLVERYAKNNEYEEIVQVWQQIPEYQLDRIHLNTRISYGNALMALHQEEEAAKIYQQIVDLMSASDDQQTDILSLRKVLADLYTASGSYDKAEKQYVEISNDYKNLEKIEAWAILQLSILERSEIGSPELKEYSALLRNYLGFTAARDGYKLVWQADKFLVDYPYSPVSSNIDIIKTSTLEEADRWLEAFLGEVDTMAGEERFQDALLKLETLPSDILSGEKQVLVRQKTDDLILAEAVSRETKKIEQIQVLQKQWNDALLLIDKENYDEALEILTGMLDSEYALKAEQKIAEVSLLAARAERRNAADLFIRFTKTADIESKKKLLIDSRRKLVDILIKYPNVEITDKVMGNIERVEKEMNILDPSLISQTDIGGEKGGEGVREQKDPFDQEIRNPADTMTSPEMKEQNIE